MTTHREAAQIIRAKSLLLKGREFILGDMDDFWVVGTGDLSFYQDFDTETDATAFLNSIGADEYSRYK